MKQLLLLLLAFILSYTSFAQRTIQMRNIWTRPQVHVLFQGYTLSFTIKDINRAMELLQETADTSFGKSCGLDTAGNYVLEFFPGFRQEYHSTLLRLMQAGVGAFLLSHGLAYIENDRHKKVPAIITDMKPLMEGVEITAVKFYDPKTKTMLFDGLLKAGMYNKDLGIDY